MTQRIIPITSDSFIPRAALENGLDWTEVYGNDRPLALEIGCGTGHFILELARQQPETNFVAIDIYNKGCLKTCRKIDESGLTNIRVMRVEARYLLYKGMAPRSLRAIYINCPDPWPKKRHRSRRLVNREFLDIARDYLVPNGDFFFSTDFDDYAEQVAELFAAHPGYVNRLERDIITDFPGYPSSKYMRRFLERGQPIYYQHQRSRADVPVRSTDWDSLVRGFRVDWRHAENE